jgi:hypothetical protein
VSIVHFPNVDRWAIYGFRDDKRGPALVWPNSAARRTGSETSDARTTAIERAADLIGDADALIIAAGVGMGVDSGLPDFRGSEGFWNAYPALGRDRISFSGLASPASFMENPALAHGFYGHRLALYRATQPHAGFAILKKWVRACRTGVAFSRQTS